MTLFSEERHRRVIVVIVAAGGTAPTAVCPTTVLLNPAPVIRLVFASRSRLAHPSADPLRAAALRATLTIE
jgi:hypothetical protein